MAQKEEALKKRLIDFIFDYDYSLTEISSILGMSKAATNFWLFHGYNLATQEQKEYINNYLVRQGY